jgi:hypothetical protein
MRPKSLFVIFQEALSHKRISFSGGYFPGKKKWLFLKYSKKRAILSESCFFSLSGIE